MKADQTRIGCDRCPASITLVSATFDGRKLELRSHGWLDCPRKGGKLAAMCPSCRPTGEPSSTMGRSTP